jgi:hypothetical protein
LASAGYSTPQTDEEHAMTSDYDAPHRRRDDEEDVEGLEELKAVSATVAAQQPEIEQDEAAFADSFELPGADMSGETLVVHVEPQHEDEFVCSQCFLVHHHSQRTEHASGVCQDCA